MPKRRSKRRAPPPPAAPSPEAARAALDAEDAAERDIAGEGARDDGRELASLRRPTPSSTSSRRSSRRSRRSTPRSRKRDAIARPPGVTRIRAELGPQACRTSLTRSLPDSSRACLALSLAAPAPRPRRGGGGSLRLLRAPARPPGASASRTPPLPPPPSTGARGLSEARRSVAFALGARTCAVLVAATGDRPATGRRSSSRSGRSCSSAGGRTRRSPRRSAPAFSAPATGCRAVA